MYCLDTYALIEIAEGNPKFSFLIKEDIIIPSTTLAEFYWILLRNKNEEAEYYIEKLRNFSVDVQKKILLKAQKFRYLNKKKDLSFFNCVGYIFSRENNYIFVTGDKEFKNIEWVKFIQK